MKLVNCFASAGIALMLGIAVPSAWGQATESAAPGIAAVVPAATSPIVPAEKAAPGAPGSEMSANTSTSMATAPGNSQPDKMSADYVAKKIAEAQAQGKDVTTAKVQQVMGNAALKNGMNDEAAQHFDTALRSIGIMPNAPGENASEGNSGHQAMPGAVN
jgi:hypothetical protein